MADPLEGRSKEIIDDPNYVVVAIPRQDGTVQSVITWVDTEGDHLRLNSAEGRSWPANLRRAGTATITAMADGNPYEYVTVTARLDGDTHEGADEHIDTLAKKYLGVDRYPYRDPASQRILFRLRPERVRYCKPR